MTVALELKRYDSADYLNSDEAQSEYLSLAFESGEEALIKKALSTVARARGMAEVAKDANLSRQGLYKSLSESGDPRLSTLLGVLKALGMQVTVRPAPS
jgi:probable addiction module antidote protein